MSRRPSRRTADGARPFRAGDTLAARAVLLLYPPAWRARYADEVRALLDDTGAGLPALASLALRAVPAWLLAVGHLHDADGRMRASVCTVLAAWAALTGIGVVFAQLTQLQGFRPAGHPVIGWSYLIFDVALGASVAAAAAGGVPLWLQMLRQARNERRPRETAGLWLALATPAGYLLAAALTLRVVRDPEADGPWWFVSFAVLGFGAAALASAGPILALQRLRPRGRAVRIAAGAAALSAVTVSIAGLASGIAATGLCLWARDFVGFHRGAVLDGYLTLVVATAATALVSAARGIRAGFALRS